MTSQVRGKREVQQRKKVLVTGDRPTGPLHLGHLVGSLEKRIELLETHDVFIMLADLQALTDHFSEPAKVRSHVFEVLRDYLAVGIAPEKATLFVQSQVPALTEITFYYMNLVTVSRLERNPTVKAEIIQKGLEESLPAGFLCYPVSQAADITAFQADCVPVGEDQLPMLELTNEIVRRFNRIYGTDFLREAEPVLGRVRRLVGIDGHHKASKSLNNAIFLKDSPQEIRAKVFSMYTDPAHIHVKDPGKVEGNAVFAYLDAFHPDAEEVSSLKSHYARGGLGDQVLKGLLNTLLQEKLEPIRQRRQEIHEDVLHEILHEGNRRARERAHQTLELIREAMALSYS